MLKSRKVVHMIMVCLIAVYAMLAATGAEASDKKYHWIVGLSTADKTAPVEVCRKFSELLKTYSDGRIVLDVYPDGAMGGDIEIGENVQSGTYTFLCNMPSNTTVFIPKGAIFDTCGVFQTEEQALAAVDGEFGKMADAAYQEAGFKILGFANMGFRLLTSNVEIKSVADLKGLKIRTIENPHHLAFWTALGTNPTPVDWAETYLALQQGVVTACEQPYAFIVSNKLYEVQKYIYKTNHLFQYVQLVMNLDQYNSLDADDRAIVDKAGAEACAYGRELIKEQSAAAEKFLAEHGTVILDAPADVMELIAATAKDYSPEIIKVVGQEMFDAYTAPVK